MGTATMYWRRFAASATAWLHSYRNDPFVRTEINTILIQIGFMVGVISLVVITYVVAGVQLTVSKEEALIRRLDPNEIHTPAEIADVRAFVEDLNAARIHRLEVALSGVILLAIVFALIGARIIMKPVRSALASQKKFIGNIAHELRTPLSIIKTNNEVALLDPAVTSDVRDMIESNTEELDRISEIINNLLSLSALVNPGRMKFGGVDMPALAADVIGKLSSLAIRSGVRVTLHQSNGAFVWGNATALQQVFGNIIRNAIIYTPRGGSVTVDILSDMGDHQVKVVVRDTGIGIARKDLAHIFEPFYRADPARVRARGESGLGLTIVSELVRLHKGAVGVKSVIGSGTTVSVMLPAASTYTHDEKMVDGGTLNEVGVDFSRAST
jgi:signal transduction histidine kinase